MEVQGALLDAVDLIDFAKIKVKTLKVLLIETLLVPATSDELEGEFVSDVVIGPGENESNEHL